VDIKMKQIGLLFFLLFGIFLISCESGNDDRVQNEITFWHFYSEQNQREALMPLIKEFEESYGCKINTTELSWADGKTKLLAAFNSGTAPDVLELGSDWVAQFSSAEVLEELPVEYADTNKFVDFTLAPGYWNNKLFAIPWVVDTRVMYYNKNILGNNGISLPSTFEELFEAVEKIGTDSEFRAYGTNGPDAHRLYKKIITFFWSAGGEIFDKKGKLVLNSPENIKALELYCNLSKFGGIDNQKNLDMEFIKGKLGFWISGSWLLEKIKNENPELVFGAMLIPGINGQKGISFGGGEYLAINQKASNKALAVDFIKFLADGKNAIRFCKGLNGSGIPADKNFYKDEYFTTNPYRNLFAQQMKASKMTPVHPQWLEIETVIETAAEKALYGKSKPKEALDEAQNIINQMIN